MNITDIISIVSVVIATIAVFQSSKAIRISNIQQLFSERIENFLIVKSCIELYQSVDSPLESRSEFLCLRYSLYVSYK